MVEDARAFASVETMLLHYFSEEYFDRTDYLLSKPNTEWSLEFELITLVSSQKSKLNHWAEKWCLNDPELLKEFHAIAEMTEGVLLSKERFLVLYQWNAKHIFSLPVHNALAESLILLVCTLIRTCQKSLYSQLSYLFKTSYIRKVFKSYEQHAKLVKSTKIE